VFVRSVVPHMRLGWSESALLASLGTEVCMFWERAIGGQKCMEPRFACVASHANRGVDDWKCVTMAVLVDSTYWLVAGCGRWVRSEHHGASIIVVTT
jgi:hypothetical protein